MPGVLKKGFRRAVLRPIRGGSGEIPLDGSPELVYGHREWIDRHRTSGMPGLHYAEEGLRGSISSRGFTPEFIVDGMPVYLSQLQLDPEEIETLTFVRDIADKALFSSRSAGG